MSESIPVSFGWQRELPSIKDYTQEHNTVKPLLATVKGTGSVNAPVTLSLNVDWAWVLVLPTPE
jgi:hypothetical protein